MRLVFVNRFFYPDHSATSQILTDLCFALAARGHEVHVVTSRLRYDDPTDALAAEETLRVVRGAQAGNDDDRVLPRAYTSKDDNRVVRGAQTKESATVHAHRVWTSRFGRGTLPGGAMDYFTFYLLSIT